MFKAICLWIIFTLSSFCLMIGHIFLNLSHLGSSFARPVLCLFGLGFFLLLAGLLWVALKKTWSQLPLLLGFSLLSAWLILSGVIYVNQDRLIFSPRSLSQERLASIGKQFPTSEELFLVTPNGISLHGWIVPSQVKPLSPAIIVFPGQGGEASSYLKLSRYIPEFAWVFFNYRGYGLSHGSPSDMALFHDAAGIYDYMVLDPRIDPANIFALGGSLGTGVATYLASQRPLRGVALFSPYDKIGGGVAQDLMPFLPTGLLIQNVFDAVHYAPQSQAPVLAIVGEADLVIHPNRSNQLLAKWGHEATIRYIPQGDHYSIYQDDGSWQELRHFFLGLVQ